MANFYQFAPALAELVQSGFIARQLEEGLDSNLAFRRHAKEEPIDGRIGSTILIPRAGRLKPVTVPVSGSQVSSNLDNGLTSASPASEMYQFSLQEWAATQDVDLIGSLVACADLVKLAARDNGVQAAQSLERLAKMCLFAAYNTGNTFVRGDLGNQTSILVHVDDIRGFQAQPVLGTMTAVSPSNPMNCIEVQTSKSGISQTFQVIGAIADTTNLSLYPNSDWDVNGNPLSDGISGTLMIQNASVGAPVSGDAIIAANAPKVIRPRNCPSYNCLNSGDLMTMQLLNAASVVLQNNNVPRFPDGTYHLIHDPSIITQLMADQAFMTLFQSRYQSTEYQEGMVFNLLGITFIPTTEAYIQGPTPQLGVKTAVRRSILLGAESLLQGNFSGLETYLNVEGLNPIGGVMMVNNVAQVIRPPIDRMLRFLSLTWTWIGSFTCPTDSVTTKMIVPTASSAIYKRAVVIETGGGFF